MLDRLVHDRAGADHALEDRALAERQARADFHVAQFAAPLGQSLVEGIRLAEAEAAYREVLKLLPSQFDALHMLGVIAAQVQNFTLAAELIGSLGALAGKVVTADALHCQRPLARTIVEKGGEYLLQIKGNQPHLEERARAKGATPGTPFSS